MEKRLGLIGLGNMGSRFARNLAEDTGEIVVWDRNPDKRASMSNNHIQPRRTLEQLVGGCDIIFLSLSNDGAVIEVVAAIASQTLEGKTIVDFSTIAPETAVEVSSVIAAKGGRMLDAAVSGSTPLVESRQLTVFVGGPADAYASVKPLLEPLGRAVYYMGSVGSGLKMKLCVNALLAVGVAALAESLTLAQKLGLKKDRAIEALSDTAVMSPSQKSKLELALNNSYAPATFSLELMQKDLGLIMDAASQLSLALPVVAAAEALAEQSMKVGASDDFAVMIQVAERAAGLERKESSDLRENRDPGT